MTNQNGDHTLGELEELRDAGIGVLDDEQPTALAAYRGEIELVLITAATIEMAGLSRSNLQRISTGDLERVFSKMMAAPLHELERRLKALTVAKPELVALAMRDTKLFSLSRKSGEIEIVRHDPHKSGLDTPFGSYITEQEFELL